MRKHIILFALLASALTGCGDTSVSSPTAPDLKALSRSMPVEEQHAYRFAGLLLQGDYAQIYQLILEVDPRFSVPEATVAGVLGMTFGYLSAGVATCGGLDTLVLADKATITPGEDYDLTYRFTMKDKTNPECAEHTLPPIKARHSNGRWDLILPMS